MDEPIDVSSEELERITRRKYPKHQIEALVFMEIPFRVRPDGSPFVARADVPLRDQPPKISGQGPESMQILNSV